MINKTATKYKGKRLTEKAGRVPWTERWNKKILQSCNTLKDSKRQTLGKKTCRSKPIERDVKHYIKILIYIYINISGKQTTYFQTTE